VTIESYLAGLERRLPRYRRRRVLSEVEEHLRDSADRHRDELAPEEAEAAAVADFGPVELVARRLRAEVAVGETRLASAAAFGAVLLFVFPLYVVPENTLPPAPWAEKPRDILVLQLLAVGLWILGGALAATGAALAWTRWSRFAAPVLELVLLALAGSILVSAVLVVRWFAAAPATPAWPLLAAPFAVACLAGCAQAAGWAHSRRCLIVRD